MSISFSVLLSRGAPWPGGWAGRAACLPPTLPARGGGHIHQPGSPGADRELPGRRMCAGSGAVTLAG